MSKLWLLAPMFCASKLPVPTIFNTDICNLDFVHYADNSHRSCRGPTFEKYLFVSKNAKDVFKGSEKNHNFACASNKRLVFNSVERREHYPVILKNLGCFVKCASF